MNIKPYKIEKLNSLLDRIILFKLKVDDIYFDTVIFYNKFSENFEIQCLEYEKLKSSLNIKISRNLSKNDFIKNYINVDTYNYKKYNIEYDYVNKYCGIKEAVDNKVYNFMNEKYIFSDYIKNKNCLNLYGHKFKEFKNNYVCIFVERIVDSNKIKNGEITRLCRTGAIEISSKNFTIK